MISPERLATAETLWLRLLAGYDVVPAAALPAFDALVAAYAEPHRHYHTLEHVGETARVATRLASHAADPAAVHLAVWYHDAVYDPRAADNEARSAEFAAAEFRKMGMPDAVVLRVSDLIAATDHRGTATPDADAAVLLDADLAILGASEVRYARYVAAVRREYAWVPDDVFRPARAKILAAFLARGRIYHTPPMLAEGEAAARRNLAAELATLRG